MALCHQLQSGGLFEGSRPFRYSSILTRAAGQRRVPATTAAAWRPDDGRQGQMADHYATLQVPRGAREAAVKAAYRRLQKKYHPDNSQGDAVRSAEINMAYRTLTDREARARYDADLRRNGPPLTPPMRDVEGLVGPLQDSGVLLVEALPACGPDGCDPDARDDMIQFVRQWGATLTWSAELPLPLPLQYDEVAGGCRLGFVTVRDGAVRLVGELRFTVVPAEESATDASPDAAAAPFVVAARRQGSTGPLPGEERILRSFRAVCHRHRTPEPANGRGFRLSGVLAAVAAGAVGFIPFMGSEDRRTYERYHLKRMPAAPAPAATPADNE